MIRVVEDISTMKGTRVEKLCDEVQALIYYNEFMFQNHTVKCVHSQVLTLGQCNSFQTGKQVRRILHCSW